MKLLEIQEILKAKIIAGDDKLDTEIKLGAASDLMSDLLRGPIEGAVILSGLNNIQLIRTSVIGGACAVVLVRDKMPDEDMIAHASDHGLPLLCTPFTMLVACGRVFSKGLRGLDM